MLIGLKSFINKHKYAFFIFWFMFVYNFVVIKQFSFPEMDEITYTYHIVDFSVGFCTKLLPGAICNAILPTTEFVVVNLYFLILYHTFLIIVAFMLEAFLKKFNANERMAAFIMVMFFITGPATFSIHIYRFGMLDTYWLFFTALFFIAVQNKVLRWFVPVIFILSVFIHVSAMISFVPFFALIVLIETIESDNHKKSYLCIFALCVIVSFITFIYFTSNEADNLQLTLDEFRTFISSKNLSALDDYTMYYDYSLYRISYLDGTSIRDIPGLFGGLLLQIKETVRAYKTFDIGYLFSVVKQILLSVPIVLFLYKYVYRKFRDKKHNFLGGFVYFCSLFLFPLSFVCGVLCSPDITRWYSHSLIMFSPGESHGQRSPVGYSPWGRKVRHD